MVTRILKIHWTDTTEVGKQNSLSLRNDNSAMMAENLPSASSNLAKRLEDEVKS